MKKIDEIELASKLRIAISRLGKVVRNEVKHDQLLSLTERSTLSVIEQNPKILPSELAAKEKVTGQAMSQIINKLSKNGFVKKMPCVKDKRKVLITITAAGKKIIELKRNKSEEWLAKIISEKMTSKEKEILWNAADLLAKLVD